MHLGNPKVEDTDFEGTRLMDEGGELLQEGQDRRMDIAAELLEHGLDFGLDPPLLIRQNVLPTQLRHGLSAPRNENVHFMFLFRHHRKSLPWRRTEPVLVSATATAGAVSRPGPKPRDHGRRSWRRPFDALMFHLSNGGRRPARLTFRFRFHRARNY